MATPLGERSSAEETSGETFFQSEKTSEVSDTDDQSSDDFAKSLSPEFEKTVFRSRMSLLSPGSQTLAEFIQLTGILLRAAENYDYSYNHEQDISLALSEKIKILPHPDAVINVTVVSHGVKQNFTHNLLSIILNQLFPAHPESRAMAEWLLDHGASIQYTHPSAMHKAICIRCETLVMKLFHSGLMSQEIDCGQKRPFTPYNLAKKMSSDRLADFFVSHHYLTDTDISEIGPVQIRPLTKICSRFITTLIGVYHRETRVKSLKIPEPLQTDHILDEPRQPFDPNGSDNEYILRQIYKQSNFKIYRFREM
ncbi:hypothetical protein Btru_066438 [Bulinus truncatus]|nr:hypothetical protein Btru_066438 [Bulinus truncatus]